jgi:hypothetical protein
MTAMLVFAPARSRALAALVQPTGSALRALVLGLLMLAFVRVAVAEPPTSAQRLEAVATAREAAVAEGAIRQAREALARADARAHEGDEAAARRANAIADAAITLAERRVARARAEAGRHDAERHRRQALRRVELAREALAHARTPQPTEPAGVVPEAEEKP